jgi:hypothetical protein
MEARERRIGSRTRDFGLKWSGGCPRASIASAATQAVPLVLPIASAATQAVPLVPASAATQAVPLVPLSRSPLSFPLVPSSGPECRLRSV